MRKTTLYIATSIDGYIATVDDNLDWLYEAAGTDKVMEEDYNDFYGTVDTVIMGNGTYKFVVNEGIEDPYPGKEAYVITRKEGRTSDYVIYTNQDPVELAKSLKEQEGGDIWVVGGGAINGQLLAAGLIDELQITIAPVTLGRGVKLFKAGGDLSRFELVASKVFSNNMIKLTYKLSR